MAPEPAVIAYYSFSSSCLQGWNNVI